MMNWSLLNDGKLAELFGWLAIIEHVAKAIHQVVQELPDWQACAVFLRRSARVEIGIPCFCAPGRSGYSVLCLW